MIDLHCHILPGLDDGARDLPESIAMAKLAAAEGIRTIIATPHHANGLYVNEAEVVKSAVERLNEALKLENIPVEVRCGQEIRVFSELIEQWEAGEELLTLNGTDYILLELPSGRIPSYFNDLLHEVQVMGLTPIIAHPERNAEIAADLNKLKQFIEQGALSQLTSHSLVGAFGKKIQRLSIDMCKRNLVHFIASDAHNLDRRAFRLSESLQIVSQAVGPKYADYYITNSEAVTVNAPIQRWEPQGEKKWYRWWK